MLNGDGIRVVLFVSGCDHHCKNCQNPETWDPKSGIPFDEKAKEEIFTALNHDYISGLTLSGGDPLNENNLEDILNLVKEVKEKFPNKNIWLYTGYEYNDFYSDSSDMKTRMKILEYCDVLVDGKFIPELADINYPYAGSTNQNIICLKNNRS